ncbi:MAG: accessory factor UbiK family protein [Gammaproteobacteria bacterium]|nr:accessory factor UbiK family protein [Gammaproteobacteria bacterium]
MDTQDIADNLGEKIANLLPESFADTRQDIHSNVITLLEESLSKLNIVNREEFDIQAEILANTRIRLEAAEKQLSQLEEQLKPAANK